MNKLHSLFIAIIMVAGFSFSAFGQYFEKDKSYIGIGRAFPSSFNEEISAFQLLTDEKIHSFGPFVLNYELGIHEYIGIFIQGKFANARYDIEFFDGTESILFYDLGVDARIVGHYPKIDKIDPYAAVGISYNSTIINLFGEKIPEEDSSKAIGVIGLRFHFDNNYSAYLEFASGQVPFALGVNFKI